MLSNLSYQDTLANKIKKLTNDLELFSYILSHDLQKPIRELEIAHQILIEDHPDLIKAEVKEFTQLTKAISVDFKNMLQGLLEYIRLELYPPSLMKVDCNEILTKALQKYSKLCLDNNITITYDKLPIVMGYPKHLEYLFTQLIDNSIKFRRDKRQYLINIDFIRLKDHYEFSVTDQALTIDEEFYEIIFLLFQRLHTKEEISGYGIGLALCKKIVHYGNGTIKVESNKEGNKFIFTLPAEII